MGGDAKKEKKKVRRIIGKPLAQIRQAMKRTNQKAVERDEWRRKWAEEKALCEDQPHWGLHVIFDADIKGVGKEIAIDPVTKAISVGDRVVLERMPREIVTKDGDFGRAITALDVTAGDIIEKWALRMACSPKAIDLQTGVINDEDADNIYEGVDPSKLPNPMEDIDASDEPDDPEDDGAPLDA